MNHKNTFVKKLTAIALCLCMVLPVLSTGFSPLSALLDGIALNADAAISGIKIIVPETLYLTPSTSSQTAIQYYINNNADGSVKTSQDTTAEIYVTYPGAKLTSISAKTSAAITLPSSITGLVGTTFGTGATKATGTFSLGAGLNAGETALVEWTFVFDVNGKTQTHYAYSVAYAPWYQPVGAAARAKSSHHSTYASSILWVSGVHGYSNGSRANSYYVQTGNFLPMLGKLASPDDDSPDSVWIQSGSNGLSPTMSYQNKDGGSYHVYSNVISPTANLTVDTSRYNNFNQIPNFRIGFMVTDRENSNNKEYLGQNGKNYYYVSEYSASASINTNSYFNGTDGSSSQYTDYYNDKGTQISNWYSDSDSACGIKVNQQQWDKAISGTANFRIKSAVKSGTGKTITTTAWNNNFVNISVTGANKGTLRTNVLNGTSYAKENYTDATWGEYYSALKTAATNLGNPTSSTVDTSTLTSKESALKTTVYFDANGGTLVGAASETFTIGANTTATHNTTNTATRTGYTFKGWSADKNATTGATSLTLGFNQTVYAVWEANKYNVTFDNLIDFKAWNKTTASNGVISDVTDNGFTLTCNSGAGEGTSASPYFAVEPGKSYKIDIDFIGDGWDVYIFFCNANGGWVDFADGASNRYSSNGSTGVSVDNAVFTAPNKTEVVKAQIRVDANNSDNTVRFENIRVYEVGTVADGVSYESPVTVTYDSAYGTLPTPTKTGYTFAGWVDADGNKVNETDTVKITETQNLYSTWTINQYTITFANTGDSTIAPIKQDYATDITAPADPVKTGYTFAGWDREIPATMPAEDITITAQWNINQYTITFDTDGGTAVAPITQDYGTAVDAPANPTKTGYIFAGWDKEIPATMPAEDITITAKWNIDQFTITFDTDGGTAVAPITQDYGTAVDAPAEPTKTGYTFAGWDKQIPATMPAEDMTITAQWNINQYTITFDTDGGTEIAPITQDFATDVTAPANPTKTGYTFAGWDVAVPATMPAEDMTITAQWTANTYTVVFDGNGHTDGSMAAQTMTYDTAANLNANGYAKTDYTFNGWNTAANGSGTAYADKQSVLNLRSEQDATITLYAQWKQNDAKYTVNYYLQDMNAETFSLVETIAEDSFAGAVIEVEKYCKDILGFTYAYAKLNDGTDEVEEFTVADGNTTAVNLYYSRNEYTITFDTDGGTAVAPITQDYATDVTKPANPTKTGYTFAGWNTEIPATMPAENMTVKAKWTINQYTITFDTDGGTEIAPITQDFATDITAPANPTKTGYTFAGWNTEIPATMPAEDMTITAQWTINQYTITFDTDGGTEIAPITQDYATEVTAPADPARTGYTFAGWDVPVPATMPAEDMTITAKWNINQYTITFDTDGGTEIAPITQDYATDVTAPADPAKTGYTFAGWDTEIPATMPDENVTITAQWTINQYTITFDTDGGTEIAPITQDYATEVTKPADPAKTGYTFAGWDVPVPATMPDENVTITAQWTINQYTITFANTGDSTIAPITQDFATDVTAPADPTRTGYTFAGWDVAVPATMPAEDMTITAQWTAVEYSVSYDLNGGTAQGNNPTVYTIESDAFTLTAPVRNGYTFIGWSGTDIDDKVMEVTVPAGSVGARSYKANWEIIEYTIAYDLDGGTVNGENPKSYTVEDAFTLVNPQKEGYTFAGWTGTGIVDVSMVISVKNVTGDRSYTANWRAKTDTPYTVIHYQQDIGANTYTAYETENLTGKTATEVTPKVKTYPGFTSPAAQTVTILPDGSAKVEYYYTRNTYTVYFDSNGGTAVDSMTFAFGETLAGIEEPTCRGYTFAGWIPALPETMTAGNLYVTASWRANSDTPYTVYHYFQDVDCISYPEELMKTEYCHGETGATVEVATWDVEGFTAPAKRSITIAADGSRVVRYYYTRNTYTVTFVDHNEQVLDMQSVVYGLAATPPALTDRTPDENGHYTFTGWSEDISFIRGYVTVRPLYKEEAHIPGADADCVNAQKCSVCGYVIAPATGHIPVEQTPAKAPTCTEAGNTADSVCSVCGEVVSTYKVLPALGHDVGSWFVDVPATETTTGLLKRCCSRCDLFETYEIPILDAIPVTSVAITTQGTQAYVGTTYQLRTKITPADAGNKQVIWESSDPSVATVNADGYITSRKPGEVTFTVTTLDGIKTDSITVNFYYSASTYSIVLVDVFGCEVFMDGKQLTGSMADVVRVKAGSTIAFTLDPTTTEYVEQGGYILTANGKNVKPDANGVYYINNVYENIEISALPVIGKPEFDENQNYDTDETPKKSIFSKLFEFFEKIIAFFRSLFGMD